MTTIGDIVCPCCDGTGVEDEWYETDDCGYWEQFTEVCRLCKGVGYFTPEQAVIMKLRGEF